MKMVPVSWINFNQSENLVKQWRHWSFLRLPTTGTIQHGGTLYLCMRYLNIKNIIMQNNETFVDTYTTIRIITVKGYTFRKRAVGHFTAFYRRVWRLPSAVCLLFTVVRSWNSSENIVYNWRAAEWSTGSNQFNESSGRLVIHDPGIYLIYAQVSYLNHLSPRLVSPN